MLRVAFCFKHQLDPFIVPCGIHTLSESSAMDFGRRILLRYTSAQELDSQQERYERDLANLHAVTAQPHLPGIGHAFWQGSEVFRNPTLQMDEMLVSRYAILSPLLGTILDPDNLARQVDSWKRNVSNHLARDALYRFADSPVIFGQVGDAPHIGIPVAFTGPPQVWQNAVPMTSAGLRRFHGTRTNVTVSIMSCGVKSSPTSHGHSGVWMTGDIRLAGSWNINPLDEFPTAILQLWVDHTSMVTSQAVRAGNITRAVSVPPQGTELPNLHIEQMYLRIPTVEHVHWQKGFHAAVIRAIQKLAPTHAWQSVFQEVWALTSWRLCYRGSPGSMELDFGGPFSSAFPLAINLSLVLAQILWGLSVSSARKKLYHFTAVPRMAVPQPIQEFLADTYPDILRFFTAPSTEAMSTGEIWRIDYRATVQRWSVQAYHYDPFETDRR